MQAEKDWSATPILQYTTPKRVQVVSVYWSPAVYGEQLIISMRNKTQVNGQNNFYFGLLESAKTPGQMFNEHFLPGTENTFYGRVCETVTH